MTLQGDAERGRNKLRDVQANFNPSALYTTVLPHEDPDREPASRRVRPRDRVLLL